MLKSVKIPRKLALSFLMICASAAVMMMVFFTTLSMIRSSTDQANQSQSIHAKALTLETSLLRQNSQLRGFLVTADSSYLKSYYEGRDEYDRTSTQLEAELEDPAQKAAVTKSREETLKWRERWGDRMIERVKRGDRDGAQTEVRGAGKAVLVSDAVLPLRSVRDAQVELIDENGKRQETALTTANTALVVGGIALISIAITLAVMLSRMIASPIATLTRTMTDLAAGKNDVAVPSTDRGDELGDMAKAVLVFRDSAIAKRDAERATADAEAAQKRVVETLSAKLSELAAGNLTATITADFPNDYAAVKSNYNDAVGSLRGVISSVMESTASIRTGSSEIAQASEDLARRTEINAASLEQTAAAVTQMNGRLKETAEAATRTVERADATITTVQGGRATADEAVQAMTRVSDSAKGIDTVIEGLDKIAFQTRVLAMNAAVEAGRAGEAGRGFAVVADLVSALAMRAEEEAGRAREQLTNTQSDVVAAVEMVQKVDRALSDISGNVGEVHTLLARMASDNQAQSTAISEVSIAIGAMDQSTQQNAAMVEQTSAAARNLASEVTVLADEASRFTVGNGSPRRAQAKASDRFDGAVKPLPAAAIPALVRSGSDDGDWQSF